MESRPLVTIATMVYADPRYLEFVLKSLDTHKNYNCRMQYLVIANDAWLNVREYLTDGRFESLCSGLRHTTKLVFNDNPDPNEWWIQRVYKGWNRCLAECDTDLICFVNNDMAFTDGWLDNLVKYSNDEWVPTSRLVEGGRMPSLEGLISKNFGQSIDTLDIDGFEKFAAEISEPNTVSMWRGAFMPSLFSSDQLRAVGGWHENQNGIPGDKITMYLLHKHLGLHHIMVHDSIVYHWQRGESAEVNDLK